MCSHRACRRSPWHYMLELSGLLHRVCTQALNVLQALLLRSANLNASQAMEVIERRRLLHRRPRLHLFTDSILAA